MSSPAGFEASGEEQTPLGDAINGATRLLHTELNKLVVSRILLALPPHTANPSAYVTGLLHVAPIYLTFEASWQNLVAHHEKHTGDQPRDDDTEARIRSILSQLRLPGLMRSSALRSDIKALTGWPEHVIEEQLQATSTQGNLQRFLSEMRTSVEQNPHVIIAYAWIFYMALFSGGKFIKKSLEQADSKFWAAEPDPVRPSLLPCAVDPSLPDSFHSEVAGAGTGDASAAHALAFFRFDTPSGGEDLKLEFKKRFAESGPLLTAQERAHVLREAVFAFENTILLVSQLDELFKSTSASPWTLESLANLLTPRPGSRLRDSVAVAKERGLRANKLVEDPERRSRPSTTSSISVMNAHGALTPSTELMADPSSHGPQSKTVRFERKLSMPLEKSGQNETKDHCVGRVDGPGDEEDVGAGGLGKDLLSYRVSWRDIVLAGLALMLMRGYYYLG